MMRLFQRRTIVALGLTILPASGAWAQTSARSTLGVSVTVVRPCMVQSDTTDVRVRTASPRQFEPSATVRLSCGGTQSFVATQGQPAPTSPSTFTSTSALPIPLPSPIPTQVAVARGGQALVRFGNGSSGGGLRVFVDF